MNKLLILLSIFFTINSFAQPNAIINFSPGGGLDISMRHFQKYMLKNHNININFVFKPGAEGFIGLQTLSDTSDSDNTLGFTTLAAVALSEKKGLSFNYISATRQYATVLVSSFNSDVNTYSQLISNMKHGRVYTFGQASPAHNIHLNQFFNIVQPYKNQIVVNYRGAGNIVNDLLGGHVQLAMLPLATVERAISSGKLILLASSQQISENVPPLKIINTSGYGVVMSTKASASTVAKWTNYIAQYLNDPQTQETFKKDVSESYAAGPLAMRKVVDQLAMLLEQ